MACFYSSRRFFSHHTAYFNATVFFIRTINFSYAQGKKCISISRIDFVFSYESTVISLIRISIHKTFYLFSSSKTRNRIVTLFFNVVHHLRLQKFFNTTFCFSKVGIRWFFVYHNILNIAVSLLFKLFFVFFNVVFYLAIAHLYSFIIYRAVLQSHIVNVSQVFFLVISNFSFSISSTQASADKVNIHLLFSPFNQSVFLYFPLVVSIRILSF